MPSAGRAERKIKMTKERIQSILDSTRKIFERRLAQANATQQMKDIAIEAAKVMHNKPTLDDFINSNATRQVSKAATGMFAKMFDISDEDASEIVNDVYMIYKIDEFLGRYVFLMKNEEHPHGYLIDYADSDDYLLIFNVQCPDVWEEEKMYNLDLDEWDYESKPISDEDFRNL